jgi:cysteine sulfinate desulfinase/cysteine desulfurase-like protein
MVKHCQSQVIKAMGYSDDEANEAIRLSWCHLTPGRSLAND